MTENTRKRIKQKSGESLTSIFADRKGSGYRRKSTIILGQTSSLQCRETQDTTIDVVLQRIWGSPQKFYPKFSSRGKKGRKRHPFQDEGISCPSAGSLLDLEITPRPAFIFLVAAVVSETSSYVHCACAKYTKVRKKKKTKPWASTFGGKGSKTGAVSPNRAERTSPK